MIKEITVEASIEKIPEVTDIVTQILEDNGCSIKVVMGISVVLDEVLSNIAFYAYPKDISEDLKKSTICVEIPEEGDRIILTFSDNGMEYNPLLMKDPDTTLSADERQIGGLGIFIVKKTMDEVSYERADDSNILTVVKYLK